MKKTCITLLIIFSFFLCFVTVYASNELNSNKSHRTEIKDNQTNNNSGLEENDSRILFAQAWPPQTERSPQNERPQIDSEKIYEMIAWRFVRFLELNEEQWTKFVPIYRESNLTYAKINSEIRELIDSIAKNVDNESVSVNELDKQLSEYKKLNKELAKEKEKFYEKTKKFLSDRQSIKLEIFEYIFAQDLSSRFSEINRRRSEEMRGNRGF